MTFFCENKRLRRALAIKDQGQRHVALTTLAQEIGASVLHYRGGARGYRPADEAEVVSRIRDAMRTDAVLYAAALAAVSAIAALLSAVAAWCAVMSR